MRIIINNIDFDTFDALGGLLDELPKQSTPRCAYRFNDGTILIVKKTKLGFSIFREIYP